MPAPVVHDFPIKRKGFIEDARFQGSADDLSFEVDYRDQQGALRTLTFTVGHSDDQVAGICLPATYDLVDLPRDLLVAHLRMGTMIPGYIPASKEWKDAFLETVSGENAKHLQTPVGTVKVIGVELVDDVCIKIDLQKGNGPVRQIAVTYDELGKYTQQTGFVPSTQLLVVAGSVKKEFPNHIHDYPNAPLQSDEMDDIVIYVKALEVWV